MLIIQGLRFEICDYCSRAPWASRPRNACSPRSAALRLGLEGPGLGFTLGLQELKLSVLRVELLGLGCRGSGEGLGCRSWGLGVKVERLRHKVDRVREAIGRRVLELLVLRVQLRCASGFRVRIWGSCWGFES